MPTRHELRPKPQAMPREVFSPAIEERREKIVALIASGQLEPEALRDFDIKESIRAKLAARVAQLDLEAEEFNIKAPGGRFKKGGGRIPGRGRQRPPGAKPPGDRKPGEEPEGPAKAKKPKKIDVPGKGHQALPDSDDDTLAVKDRAHPYGKDRDKYGVPIPPNDSGSDGKAWLAKKFPNLTHEEALATYNSNGADPAHPYGPQYTAKGQSPAGTAGWRAEHNIANEDFAGRPYASYDQAVYPPGHAKAGQPSSRVNDVPDAFLNDLGFTRAQATRNSPEWNALSREQQKSIEHAARIASKGPGLVTSRRAPDEEIARAHAAFVNKQAKKEVLNPDGSIPGEARPNEKTTLNGKKLGKRKAVVERAKEELDEANDLTVETAKAHATRKLKDAVDAANKANGLTPEDVARQASKRLSDAKDEERRLRATGGPEHDDAVSELNAARTVNDVVRKGQAALDPNNPDGYPQRKAVYDAATKARQDHWKEIRDTELRAKDAEKLASRLADQGKTGEALVESNRVLQLRQRAQELRDKTPEIVDAERAAGAPVAKLKAQISAYKHQTPEAQKLITAEAVEGAKAKLKLANDDPAGYVRNERVEAKEHYDVVQKRLDDTLKQYAFPQGEGSAARIDASHDYAHNGRNLDNFQDTETNGRVYLPIEGRMKADAALNAVRAEHDEADKASVISAASVTLGRGSELAPHPSAPYDSLAKAYLGNKRETIIGPDADGVLPDKRQVQVEARALQARIQIETGAANLSPDGRPVGQDNMGRVIVAVPPLDRSNPKDVKPEAMLLPSGAPENRKGWDDHLAPALRTTDGQPNTGKLHDLEFDDPHVDTTPLTKIMENREAAIKAANKARAEGDLSVEDPGPALYLSRYSSNDKSNGTIPEGRKVGDYQEDGNLSNYHKVVRAIAIIQASGINDIGDSTLSHATGIGERSIRDTYIPHLERAGVIKTTVGEPRPTTEYQEHLAEFGYPPSPPRRIDLLVPSLKAKGALKPEEEHPRLSYFRTNTSTGERHITAEGLAYFEKLYNRSFSVGDVIPTGSLTVKNEGGE